VKSHYHKLAEFFAVFSAFSTLLALLASFGR
jgi:hypothetical protein